MGNSLCSLPSTVLRSSCSSCSTFSSSSSSSNEATCEGSMSSSGPKVPISICKKSSDQYTVHIFVILQTKTCLSQTADDYRTERKCWVKKTAENKYMIISVCYGTQCCSCRATNLQTLAPALIKHN